MKHYEREYFVSRIRSGKMIINHKGKEFTIISPTVDDELFANTIYIRTYNDCLKDGIKTSEEMSEWLKESGLWTDEDEEKEKGFEKDIETLKVEIFKVRKNKTRVDQIRSYLRSGEEQLANHTKNKNMFYENTCEGISILEKNIELIKRCSYVNGEIYHFDDLDPRELWFIYYNMVCDEKKTREIVRNEPWSSLWNLRDVSGIELFTNKGRELTIDQKNLLLWSRMYENIDNSYEPPSEQVIDDDDMLDGWCIIQRRKRDKEKAEAEFDSIMNNPKFQNADEIFLMAGSKEDAESIEGMNDVHGIMTKRDRLRTIKQMGGAAEQYNFQDERLKLQQQSNKQFKDKFRR